jgi:hypothetical protein
VAAQLGGVPMGAAAGGEEGPSEAQGWVQLGFWGSFIYESRYWVLGWISSTVHSYLVMFSKTVMKNPSQISRFVVVITRFALLPNSLPFRSRA